MKLKHTIALSLAAFGILAATPRAGAQTTDWGSSTLVSPTTYLSDGTAAGSSLVWTIGWFNDGFTPTASNYASWAANYNEVDRVYEQSYDLGGGLTAWSANGHKDDGGAASYGKQAYIFLYNDLGLLGTDQGQAALFRENGFVFPDIPNQDTFDVADNPLSPKDDSFDVIWGQVDRVIDQPGGVVTGGGILTSALADSTTNSWEVQSATWATAPVPEPTAPLLVALGGSMALLRRRRLKNG